MLAQYYNSDSEDEEKDQNDSNISETTQKSEHLNGNSQTNLPSIPTLSDEIEIPAEIQRPPQELKIIIDKTASYVLKNGKDFEEILRAKNDKRFTFLQYKDPYYKYYTFKLTGIVCSDPASTIPKTAINLKSEKLESSKSSDIELGKIIDTSKHIGKVHIHILTTCIEQKN